MTHVTQSNVTMRPFARGFPIRPLRIIPSASSPCWVFLIQPRSGGHCTNILSALILEPAGGATTRRKRSHQRDNVPEKRVVSIFAAG